MCFGVVQFDKSGNVGIEVFAFQAATRHRCSFLISLHEREFERTGGDPRWLKGLKYVEDPKILYLDSINIILAHQPWLCDGEYVTVGCVCKVRGL